MHCVTDDIRRLMCPAVIHLVQHPEDTPLNRFESVIHIGNRAVLDDVSGVVQKVTVHHRPEIGIGIGVFTDSSLAVCFRSRNFSGNDFCIFRSLIQFITHIWRPPDLS